MTGTSVVVLVVEAVYVAVLMEIGSTNFAQTTAVGYRAGE